MANLTSPLAGKVLEVQIKAGQAVDVDDEIMIIEAMKMENPVYATEGGTVKEVKVNAGDAVEVGTVLAVIE
ncbi:MAG: acetyl-CoA carboxylase biotin carboxyl carrier protein subunit [Firmicutes bacterium]|nr:acetyl-CoA carboxylase biotin carboxyl carrier protein subunit [Bacillota bacterium]